MRVAIFHKSDISRAHRLALRLKRHTRGQDLIEYALLAGLVAVSAGVAMPDVHESISIITRKVSRLLWCSANRPTRPHCVVPSEDN